MARLFGEAVIHLSVEGDTDWRCVVACSDNAKTIATASQDKTIKSWNLNTVHGKIAANLAWAQKLGSSGYI